MKSCAIILTALLMSCSTEEDDSANSPSANRDRVKPDVVTDEDYKQKEPTSPPPESTTPRVPCTLSDPNTIAANSIEEMVALINLLPKPASIPCLLDVLPKPFKFAATSSQLSVQPAVNDLNPRIFIAIDNLILTFVPEGEGAKAIEFSQLQGALRSIKGEIAFPVTETLAVNDPYLRIKRNDGAGTRCEGCHAGEMPTLDNPDAYISKAIRPFTHSVVSIKKIQEIGADCAGATSTRCDILNSLFGDKGIQSWSFPETMPTMF